MAAHAAECDGGVPPAARAAAREFCTHFAEGTGGPKESAGAAGADAARKAERDFHKLRMVFKQLGAS